jgi:hypothetical protein
MAPEIRDHATVLVTPGAGYLWRYLPYHLYEGRLCRCAGRADL